MSRQELTAQQAFNAMFAFLERMFDEGRFTELGALLGSMNLLPDGKPADPGFWEEWEEAIEKSLERPPRMTLE